jgi:hypothetical protein
MAILQETAQLARQKLGSDFEKLTVDRVAVGLFFTGAKLSNGAGGVSYTPVKDIPQAGKPLMFWRRSPQMSPSKRPLRLPR